MTIDKISVRQIFDRFPNDNSCLDQIMKLRIKDNFVCESCHRKEIFHKITGRRAFVCTNCGHHFYPCAGTILENSQTPLRVWFYLIFIIISTGGSISIRDLQQILGVTYKTAWRMKRDITQLIDLPANKSRITH